MEDREFKQLVANIKRDGKLTSVPFCYINENDEIEVLSGNHRVMASIDAGINEIEVMLCKEKLTKQRALSIQLSHNSLVGKDDESILEDLYKQINNLEEKEYSGLFDEFNNFCKQFEKDFKIPSLAYQSLNLLFLPNEIKEAKKIINQISLLLNEKHILANMKDYDE